MHGKFKIIKVDNEILTVNYDGGGGIFDGLIEYNVITKEYKVINYSSEDVPNGVFVKWLMSFPKFVYYAKESYNNQEPDNHNRVINCG